MQGRICSRGSDPGIFNLFAYGCNPGGQGGRPPGCGFGSFAGMECGQGTRARQHPGVLACRTEPGERLGGLAFGQPGRRLAGRHGPNGPLLGHFLRPKSRQSRLLPGQRLGLLGLECRKLLLLCHLFSAGLSGFLGEALGPFPRSRCAGRPACLVCFPRPLHSLAIHDTGLDRVNPGLR